MIPKSNLFPGNWISKFNFETFAWAFEWVGIIGQTFDTNVVMGRCEANFCIWGDFGSEPPTHLDATHAISKIEKNSKSNSQGMVKIVISPESAWFTDSFLILENKKNAQRKLCRFPIPEFNLTMLNLFLSAGCFVAKLGLIGKNLQARNFLHFLCLEAHGTL